MSVILERSWIDRLLRLPETGMGYQVVELGKVGPRREHVVVVNGTMALEPSRGRLTVREGVEKATLDRIERTLTTPVDPATFRVLTRHEAILAKAIEERGTRGTGPASDAAPESSIPEERFLRYSAYPNDRRIMPDGSVTPGTYVTTYHDGITYVRTGMDAVRRYALPNPDPAVHRYHLKPPTRIQVRRGTAQPAFGQPGGGAEVIFESGSPARTKQYQDVIPAGK